MAVMYLGKIVEIGTSDDIIDKTAHPYTKALIEAVPTMEIGKTNLIKKIPIKGEIPSATNIPPGCRFHPRCPYATDICKREEPEYRDLGNGHLVACHHLF
jgi:peptide/nickel transport system ATP-binding protein